jgi:DNA-binding MarR family transcriptional regulator
MKVGMTTERKDLAARDVYLDLVRAHERLFGEFSALFRDHGLTQAQYNVLRILLGGPREGASCQYVGERLLNRVPDVTRLIDRMEAAGLVRRARSTEDRRVVLVRVTSKGRKLCERLDAPVLGLHRQQLAHLPAKKVAALGLALQELLGAP